MKKLEPLVIKAKRKDTQDSLLSSVGLVVRNQNVAVVALKSANIFNFYRHVGGSRHVFVWAIGGSTSDIRNLKSELIEFQAYLADTFSLGDLNVNLIHDFLASYLRKGFYNLKSAEPLAVELIFCGIDKDRMIFFMLDYEGKSVLLNKKSPNISIVGGSIQDRNKLFQQLSKYNFENMRAGAMVKVIEPLLADDYDGDFAVNSFAITDKSVPKKRTKVVKKNNKKGAK